MHILVFDMQNCTGGVNQDCIADNPGEEWRCFVTQVSDTLAMTDLIQLPFLVCLLLHQNSNICIKPSI